MLVKAGIGLAAFLIFMGFAQGVVKSSQLFLTFGEISTYTQVSDTITRLAVPYDYLNSIALGLDLMFIVCAIVAGLTLYSPKTNLHWGANLGFVIAGASEMIANFYYGSLVRGALQQLPTVVDPNTLSTFSNIQSKFEALYGFWDSPAYYATVNLASLAALSIMIGAILTCKVVSTWKRASPQTDTPTAITPLTEQTVEVETTKPVKDVAKAKAATKFSPNVPTQTKFCRYCGVKILRTSKFCEECGSKLVE